MGNRANVFIQTDYNPNTNEWDGIGIYSHWHGTALHTAALDALPAALRRAGDPSYFTRILIHRILVAVADPDADTGTGLWTTFPCDNEHPILVVNAETGHHWLAGEDDYRTEES